MSIDRSKAPEIHDFSSFRPEKPVVTVLANGIPVTQFLNPQLNLLHFNIRIKAGRYYEQKKNAALFCYSLLKESSVKYSNSEVDEYLDYYGVSYNVSVAIEYISINIIIPKHNCLQVLTFISDFLAHPSFKEKNLEIFRMRKLMDLAYNRKKLSYCASQLMLQHIFGEANPVGQIQSEDFLKDISIADLQEYHQQSFRAENIRIFAAGNLDDDIRHLIGDLFGDIPHGEPLSCLGQNHIVTPSSQAIVDYHEDCMQSSLYLCKASFSYHEPQRRDFNVLSTILGGYFGSRLMSNLRETNGYTYGISCDSLYFDNRSVFYIESEVNVDVSKKAIDECLKEIDRLSQEPVPEEELELVKRYMAGQLLRKVDNTVSYMTQYSKWDDFGDNEQAFELQMQSIEAFNSEQSMLLAQQFLQKKDFTTIVSGNIQ